LEEKNALNIELNPETGTNKGKKGHQMKTSILTIDTFLFYLLIYSHIDVEKYF
jgi:hypothetical protein